MRREAQPRFIAVVALLTVTLLMSGCSLLFGGGSSEEPTPATEDRTIVPTFTPTPEVPATVAPEPTVAQVAVVEVPAVATVAPVAEAPVTEEPTPTLDAPTPTPIPKAVITIGTANARSGPGIEYGLVGAVTQGQAFDVLGKNPEGTWWQFCCVNGQQAWIFGELVNVENAGSVPVAQNIPAPPVVQAPAPTQPPAAPAEQPSNTPEPAPPQAGAVNAGGCGGDDGCKFRISGGPSFAGNGGGEMKLQLFFKHSGVDGGQPQGDYRLAVERDGQLIVPFADTTSIALSKNQGSMGPYNYEAKVGSGNLPGGSLEGTYFFWVLDGNRERDSDVFQMYVPPGQGEIWIEFDQG